MKSFLRKIYIFKFLDDLILIYPLYTVMFADFGMLPWQIATLLAVWAGTSMILEVPSGVWADKYSRRNIIFVGQVIRAIGYVSWLIFPNFYGFLFGFICWGIKSALTSGTFQALVYDELKQSKEEKQFTKVLGTTKTLSFAAILVASVLASPAISLGYSFVLIMSVLAVIISALIIISIPNVNKVESTHETEYFQLLFRGLKTAFKDINLLKLILFLSLAYALGGALDEYWTIFAHGTGLPNAGLGIFLGTMSFTQSIASYFAHKFEKFSNTFFYLLFLTNGCLLLTASYFFVIPSLVLLIIFSFLFTIIHIIFEGRLQEAIPSETRATISSVNGFFVEVGVIIVYFTVGTLAQVSGYRVSFLLYGIVISTIGLIYLFIGNKKLRSKNVKYEN